MTYSSGDARAGSRWYFQSLSTCARALVTASLLFFLAGCKLVILMPAEGGSVVANSGLQCQPGANCEISITELDFFDIFTAVAAEGYVFDGWAATPGYFCRGITGDCVIDFRGVPGNDGVLALLAGDLSFYLAPEFSAADDGRYPVAEWREIVDTLNASNYRSDAFLFTVTPDADSCNPGSMTAAAKARFTDVVNLIRQLHHLPPVAYDDFYSMQMQESSLVQLANNTLTHSPNTGHDCYTSGAAAGAGSSNLSYRSIQSDPAYYPLGWVNDNRNLSAVMEAGHRRWALYPHLGFTSYGQARGYASMKVFNFGTSYTGEMTDDIDYVAFPYREYPYLMVEGGSFATPWSISMVPGQGQSSGFAYFTAATTVTVVETATGTPLTVHSEHYDSRGYGLRNFFSWMVDGWAYDTPYTVTISNVSMPGGDTRTIEYAVEIDYAELQ